MQQVLFYIPIFKESFPPDGIPIHGFGVMLFVTFILCVWYLGRRSAITGTNLPRERVQDFVILMFVSGLLGARITFMIQYGVPLQDIYRIWEGGIVLYGGIIAGILSFIGFYFLVLRKVGVKFWKLADACAPGLALAIALGRVGCFLNGCCYGHVACEDKYCPKVAFPVLTAPAKERLLGAGDDRPDPAQGEKKAPKSPNGLQTPTGFTVRRASPDDPRSLIMLIEPNSQAEKFGLKPGDLITGFNGETNYIKLTAEGESEAVEAIAQLAKDNGAEGVIEDVRGKTRRITFRFDTPERYREMRKLLGPQFRRRLGFAFREE